VTGVSGRGMGLSVVHEAAVRLQGEAELLPADGPGTRVVVSVPLSVATQRLLLVRCRDQTYAIPLGAVERLVRVTPQEIETVEGKLTLVLNGRSVPVLSLAALLGAGTEEPHTSAMSLAILRAGGRRAAVAVDALLAERDSLIKPLDGPAARVEAFAGGLLLEDGRVALVLNPATLLANAGGRKPAPAGAKAVAPRPKKNPTVLVVDDSLTTRTLEKSILEVHGYTVRLAVDGLEALTQLRTEPVDLVITDIEMPRMDGFRLIEEMKKDARFARLPVIVVTSLAKREDQERGLALGADAYIVKRKFDHQDLLDTIRQIL
jgi:two-component system, chemotaxis family, sensor kinase CheA